MELENIHPIRDRCLITSDLHLTDRVQDEYRWEIFPWLKKQAKKHQVSGIYILGDITDAKDRHSSALVNRIADGFWSLCERTQLFVLIGNHDYDTDPSRPWLRVFSGQLADDPQIVVEPESLGDHLLLPSCRDPLTEWAQYKGTAGGHKVVLTHQTFAGCEVENGTTLDSGVPRDFFGPKAKVISGDIHVPQKLGRVTYCGAPYPVRFGDSFQPRVLLLEGKKIKSLPRTTIRKLKLEIDSPTDLNDLELQEGDQLKLTVRVSDSSLWDWDSIRRDVDKVAEGLGVEVHGLRVDSSPRKVKRKSKKGHSSKPRDVLNSFCVSEGLDTNYEKAGNRLLKESK